jgi:hypothetical protein
MGIFVIMLTAITAIYMRTSQFGRQIALRSKLQSDARFALEAIARAVRVSNLDYDSWGGTLPVQPNDELRLRNPQNGSAVRIRVESDDAKCYGDARSFPCLVVSTDEGATWTPLSQRNERVETLRFYASPAVDPFRFYPDTGTYASNEQPAVTIVLAVRGLSSRAADEWTYTLQTTVTPRLYLR